MQDSLLKWTGIESDFYGTMNTLWEEKYLPSQTDFLNPIIFFDNSLKNGVFEISNTTNDAITISEGFESSVLKATQSLNKITTKTDNFEIVIKESITIGDGRNANNPWLQELPNPISKVNTGIIIGINSVNKSIYISF